MRNCARLASWTGRRWVKRGEVDPLLHDRMTGGLGPTGDFLLRVSDRLKTMLAFKIPLLRIVFLLLLLVLPSSAQTATERARSIRDSGIEAFESGEYAKAKSLFDSAGALSSSATSLLWSARSRVKLNLYLEAMEFFQWAIDPGLSREEPSVERKSRVAAAEERRTLDRQIPRLRIFLDSTTSPEQVDVYVDGKIISKELLKRNKKGPFRRGRALKLNPGRHRVVALKGETKRNVSVSLEPGQSREVRLRFPNPETVRQRKCRDDCEQSCGAKNQCYLECKRLCFTKNGTKKKRRRKKRKQ